MSLARNRAVAVWRAIGGVGQPEVRMITACAWRIRGGGCEVHYDDDWCRVVWPGGRDQRWAVHWLGLEECHAD